MLLDTVTGAACAFSMRKLRTAYAGNCLKIRRSSDDATLDIGFSGDWVDESALASFVGANDGFIDTWYDQSSNGHDAVQATTGAQPRLVSSGTINKPTPTKSGATARPAARFGFSGVRYLVSSVGTASATNITFASVAKREGSKIGTFAPIGMASASYTSVTGGYLMQDIGFNTTSGCYGFVGTAGIVAATPLFVEELQALNLAMNGSTGVYCACKNGATILSGTATPSTISAASVILGGWNSSGVNCSTAEAICWLSDKSTDLSTIVASQAVAFGIAMPEVSSGYPMAAFAHGFEVGRSGAL